MEIRVVTHSGEDVKVQVDEYNAKEIAKQLNSMEISVVELGGVIFSRIDIKMILPI